nr:sulfate adenylyltransferase subunit CysD [Candidatus Aquiluna sp. IMCC13023]
MQTQTFQEAAKGLINETRWFSASDVASEMGGSSSRRQILRSMAKLHGPLVSDMAQVTDGQGRGLNPLTRTHMKDWLASKRVKARVLQFTSDRSLLALTDFSGHVQIRSISGLTAEEVSRALTEISEPLMLIPHGAVRELLQDVSKVGHHEILDATHPPTEFSPKKQAPQSVVSEKHIIELERESIYIIREAVAAAEKPAMLFSMGKDSMAMLRLAEKAFAPEPIPFPLVVIDTRWKFQEMYAFRRWMESREDLNLIIHINPDAIAADVNPFDSGSAVHTDITKTQALKQVLDEHGFDFVFGGARRDEEKSRAKERVFSVRDSNHGWDPKNQRPELWDFYNTTLTNGQTMRVFPLSNWTEIDIWKYLENEAVPLVPLYFSRRRPYVVRNGSLIMVNDERFRLEPGEKVRFDPIRFRTLGCYPLTGGVLSSAQNLPEILEELSSTRVSERSSRVIDSDRGASMEQKKREGYF